MDFKRFWRIYRKRRAEGRSVKYARISAYMWSVGYSVELQRILGKYNHYWKER